MLAIGHVWPEPQSSAAGGHMLFLLRMFRDRDYRVVFACSAQRSAHMADLEKENIQGADILLNDSGFDTFVSGLRPDIVLFDRFMTEEQFAWRVEQACPDALRILDTEDLQCLRKARWQALKENRPLQREDLFSDLARREIAAILRSDLSLIISDHEVRLLQDTFRVDPVLLHHLPFMVDLKHLPPSGKAFSRRRHFAIIGNFRHPPNWDAVLYLQQVWPLIRKVLPDTELHIYGAYPPKKAMALDNPRTGFRIRGWADDAHAVLSDARVCLAPLRFGAGIKGKLLDAMLAGTPSVTTDIGAEGMSGGLPWPGSIASGAEEIARAAISLHENEDLWQDCRQRIHPLISKCYNSQVLADGVMDHIENIRSDLKRHRLNNFTGAMLRHHSMKSTEYLSRWIEAKNALDDAGKP